MRLAELVAGLQLPDPARRGAASVDADVEIAGLAYDSRTVSPGTLFFCVPGLKSDGHDFAQRAVRAGAVALVVERQLGMRVPEVSVRSARAAMAPVAVRFNGDPTSRLKVVGVTGTNGKTTTAFLVRALLEASDRRSTGASGTPTDVKTGLLGTVTSIVGGEQRAVQRTTPEAIDLQASFRQMLEAGDTACAMEVSSHALAMGRTSGIAFAAAIFTNLTQDHLDYHPTMEDYFQAKRSLFLPDVGPVPGVSVINVGDRYGRRLAREIGAGASTFAVLDDDRHGHGAGADRGDPGDPGHTDGVMAASADYRATDLRCDAAGCRFLLHTPAGRPSAGELEVALPMPGRFNVENALGALAGAHALGHELETLVTALERGVRVPGRFEPVEEGQDFSVLVDYAHTPDSLQNVLRAARELTGGRGRVVSVFGAGGDRDRGKRPLMGEISARLADLTIVTSDNPRSEQPQEIVAQIVAGIASARARSVQVEVDRRTAIDRAITLARAGDVVVIAGKGHEQGQELAGGVKTPFDDVQVARAALRRWAAARAGGAERAVAQPTSGTPG